MGIETSKRQKVKKSKGQPARLQGTGYRLLKTRFAALTLAVGVLAATQSAEGWPTPSFMGLGDLPGGPIASYPNDVSADGQVVIGRSDVGNGLTKSFRWTRQGGMVDLGGTEDSEPWGVSSDGSTIVGELRRHNGGYDAYKWTASSMQPIPGVPAPPAQSEAKSISGDGSVVVGILIATTPAGLDAFRWTQDSGIQLLNTPSDAFSSSQAHGISQDGSVIIGGGNTINGFEALRWNATEGLIGIGDLPGGSFQSNSLDASADGSVIVGSGISAAGPEAFLWTAETGMIGLGDLPGGNFGSSALGVSADGSIVVGVGSGSTGFRPFIWDELHGMRDLQDVLINEYHLDLTGWRLAEATGISADGTVIVGSAGNPVGRPEGWMAVIPEPATLGLCLLGVFGLKYPRRRGCRLSRRRVSWPSESTPRPNPVQSFRCLFTLRSLKPLRYVFWAWG